MTKYTRLFLWILFVSFLGTTLSTTAFAKKIGFLKVVKGDVFLKKGKGKKKKARVGSAVHSKHIIFTEKDSRAKIVMSDKNVINISPDSKMSFEKYKPSKNGKNGDVLLNILYGKVRSSVKNKYKDEDGKRFQVKTKAAVAGVRGTDFLSSYDLSTNKAQFITFEGKVDVGTYSSSAGQSLANVVPVNPGQLTTSLVGATPLPPVQMPKSDFAAIDLNTKFPDTPKLEKDNNRLPANNPKDDKKSDKKAPKEIGAPSPGQDPNGRGSMITPEDRGPDIPRGPDFEPPGGPNSGFPPPIFGHLPPNLPGRLDPNLTDIIQNGNTRLIITIGN